MSIFDRNEDIKQAKKGIPNWAIAEKLGVHENTVRSRLRSNLSTEQRERILTAIEELKRERAAQ